MATAVRTFEELLSFVVDNRGRTCPTATAGLPLIATNCVSNEYLYPAKENVRYVDQDTYVHWFRAHPKPGDIIFVLKGAPGRCALVPDPVDFCIAQDMVAVRADRDKIDPKYLFAALRSPLIQASIDRMHVGTMIPHFKKGDFSKLLIPIPDRPIQEFIGNTHMALIEKIEANRRMNETLEAMARAIFKDWFVDFGPTRAKMEGRAPYLAPDIWSLFPDRLDADGKPVGWTAESVYDQAIWVNGAAYKDMHFSSEPDALPVVKIAELKNGITKTTRFTNTDLGQRYKIVDGELLFSWSGNPDTSIDTFVWTSGTGWLNQHIFAVRPNGKRSQAFLYAMLKFLRSDFAEIARNKQTTGLGHVTQQDLIRLRITAPSEGAQAAFDDVVGPLHSRFISNLFENRSLIAARDFLIPKLMSGEIRVREAEKAVEAAQ
jgi:type I restriction enzyme S subunit